MAVTLFHEDFDGAGPGFGPSPLETWAIGGEPVELGKWGTMNGGGNLTGGSGKYAGVISTSPSFIDSLIWMVSPMIDCGAFKNLQLSADVYFKASGAAPGEDRVEVKVYQAGGSVHNLAVIGEHMKAGDPPLTDHVTWDIPGGCGVIQIAFTWYSSMGPANPDSIQLDNIKVTGVKNFWCGLCGMFR